MRYYACIRSRASASLLVFLATATSLFVISQDVYGEASSGYVLGSGGMLIYPNYSIEDFRKDMQRIRANMPANDPRFQAISQIGIDVLAGQVRDYLGNMSGGSATVDLLSGALTEYLKAASAQSLSSADTLSALEPFGKALWDFIKDRAMKATLGEDIVASFGVAKLASFPVELFTALWDAETQNIRNRDIQRALRWYVRERYRYDFLRHRELLYSGRNFRAIHRKLSFPDSFLPSFTSDPGPCPFAAYYNASTRQFEPYYIAVSPPVPPFGRWSIVLQGAPPDGNDDHAAFYNLWANLVYNETHNPGTRFEKELKKIGANAGSQYVRHVVKQYANAMLRDLMWEFEEYYYDLYTRLYLFSIRNYLAAEGCLVAALRYRDREIRQMANAFRELHYTDQTNFWAMTNAMQMAQYACATNAANANLDLGLRDSTQEEELRIQHEANAVEDLIAAMNEAVQAARSCETERVRYPDYVAFVEEFGPSGPHYNGLQYAVNRNNYLAAYNTREQNLRNLWQQNVSEFRSLLNELLPIALRVSPKDTDPLFPFSIVNRYNSVASDPINMVANLSEYGDHLFRMLWFDAWGNPTIQDSLIQQLQSLSAAQLGALASDADRVEERLRAFQNRLDEALGGLPSLETISQLRNRFLRAETLMADLVEGGPGLANPRGGWQSWWRSVGPELQWTEVPFNRYPVALSINASLCFGSRADLSSFSAGEYGDFAQALLLLTDLKEPRDRDKSAAESVVTNNPTEHFRLITQYAYQQVRKGLDHVNHVRYLISQEAERRAATPSLHWYAVGELPAQGLPYTSCITIPQVGGWGLARSLTIASNRIGLISFAHGGLWTLDLSDPRTPNLIAHCFPDTFVWHIDLWNSWAVIAGWWWDLGMLDVSNPTNLPSSALRRATQPDDNGRSYHVAVLGNYAFVADDGEYSCTGPGFKVYDLRTVTNASGGLADASLALPGARYIALAYPYAYVACGTNGLAVVEISTPTNPVLLSLTATAPAEAKTVTVDGSRLLLAMGTNGVALMSLANPTAPTLLSWAADPFYEFHYAVVTDQMVFAGASLVTRQHEGFLQTFEITRYGDLDRKAGYKVDVPPQHITLHEGGLWLTCSYMTTSVLYWVELSGLAAQGSSSGEKLLMQLEEEEPPIEHRLELLTAGTGHGLLTVTPGEESNPYRIRLFVPDSTQVEVKAEADASSVFIGWEGDVETTSNSFSIVITNNLTLLARFEPLEYFITASAGQGGWIIPSGAVSVAHNDSIEFLITPDAGWSVSNVWIDGIAFGALTSWIFSAVTTNHAISAFFAPQSTNPCAVSSFSSIGGTVTPLGWQEWPPYTNAQYIIEPLPGYQIANVCVDGTNFGPLPSFTFHNITGLHTLHAEFELKSQYVRARRLTAGGTFSPDSIITLTPSGSAVLRVIADPHYFIHTALSNGIPFGDWSNTSTSTVLHLEYSGSNILFEFAFAPQRTGLHEVPIPWLVGHGITSDWEEAVSEDPDYDGMPTWREYLANTDPLDANSSFRITGVRLSPSTNEPAPLEIEFFSSRGRLIHVEKTTNILDPSWEPTLPPFAGLGVITNVLITNHIPFLRLKASMPPW